MRTSRLSRGCRVVGAFTLGAAWLVSSDDAFAQVEPQSPFQPFHAGYWAAYPLGQKPVVHATAAAAAQDIAARVCSDGGPYAECGLESVEEIIHGRTDDRYTNTRVIPTVHYRLEGGPSRSVRIDNGVWTLWGCPAGHVVANSHGVKYPPGERLSPEEIFGCVAFANQPTDRQLGIPAFDAAGQCDGTSMLAGNPINVATSNKVQVVVDIPATGQSPLQWARTYNSGGFHGWSVDWRVLPQRRFLGSQWRGSYDAHLEATVWYDTEARTYRPAIKRHRPDGGTELFEWHGDRYAGPTGEAGQLEAVPEAHGGGWRYRGADDQTEQYDAQGRLRSITDRRGQAQVLAYSDAATPAAIAHGELGKLIAVTDAQGRSLRFTYDEAGRMATVTDPAGATLYYGYDEKDGAGLDADLADVTYADGHRESYRYHESSGSRAHQLTGILDGQDQRYATYEYTNGGRALRSQHAGGAEAVTVAVPNPNGSVTDARGATRTYVFETIQGLRRLTRVGQPAGAGCPSSAQTLTYDDQGRILTRKNHNQQTTAYGYTDDGRSLENLRIEAVGTPQERTILTDWHPSFRLPTRIQTLPTGTSGDAADAAQTLSMSYDARGNLLALKAEGAGAAAPRTWTYTYDDTGRVLTADGPRTDVEDITRYTYYPEDAAGCAETPADCAHRRGDLWKVTGPLGHVTEVTRYDGAGRPLAVKDANGVVTEMTYTPRGWLAAIRVRGATDAVTTYDYDANGQLVKTTDPDGVTLTYTYDAAHRLIGIQDALAGHIDLTLDAAGDVTAETVADANGRVVRSLTRAFDALGRVKTLTSADGKNTAFEYDPHGNLTKITRPLGQVVQTQYDALERVAQRIGDAKGLKATIAQDHDSQDQLVGVTDPKGLLTRYDRTGLGEVLEQHSPDTGVTAYDTDAAGNVTRRTDARGQVRRLRYDALNRPIEVSFDGAPEEVIRYTYDQPEATCPAGETYAIGRLTQLTDASGRTTYCYNALGQLTRKRQTTGDTTLELAYTYTPAGRLASLRYPDGHTAVYGRDANGRITHVIVTDAQGRNTSLVKDATYLPFGPVAQWRYGNGRTLARHYDADGRPVSIEDTAPGGLSARFGYDANGRLTTLGRPGTDTPLLSFTYDNLDRLTETRDGPTGTVLESYRYDLTGNRLAFTDAHGEQAYAYPADSHRLIGVAGQERRYDAMGNLIADDTRGRQFTYNAMGRMAEVKQGASVLRRYAYNAWGEQVHKTDGTEAGTTLTLYDEAGHWLGDYSATGQPAQQTIWLDDHPIGLMQAGQTYYLETDHLGTPRVAIDPARDVAVWRWDVKGEAFGSTAPDEDPDQDGVALVLDMRFPGQRYDRVTGLYYNYQRDYDYLVGRYVQSDPIGLKGGINSYTYVSARPMSHSDPSGLIEWQGTVTAVGASAGIGGALFVFDLESDCVDGARTRVKVNAFGPAIGVNGKWTLPGGVTKSSIKLKDRLNYVDPHVLEGTFAAYTAGISLIRGYGFSFVRLGGNGMGALQKPIKSGAYTNGWPFGPESGIDLGAGLTVGSSVIAAMERCGCQDE